MGDSSGDEKKPSGRLDRSNRAADTQKIRLERLMQNPEKPAHIPEPPKERPPPPPTEFVRFYMGSSAGAGSGEFHIYRNLRRKEQNRMKFIDEQAKKDKLRSEFEEETERNRTGQEEKAAKKRAKRLKKKSKLSNKKVKTNAVEQKRDEESSSSDEEDSPAAEVESVSKETVATETNNEVSPQPLADSSQPTLVPQDSIKEKA